MSNVYVFKLISGEEIIAKIDEVVVNDDKTTDYMIEAPMVLMLAQLTDSNVMPLPVAPWVLLAQTTDIIELRSNLIMHTVTNVPKIIENKYLETTTGIALS